VLDNQAGLGWELPASSMSSLKDSVGEKWNLVSLRMSVFFKPLEHGGERIFSTGLPTAGSKWLDTL